MHETFTWSWLQFQAARNVAAWRSYAALPLPASPQFTPREQRRREKVYDHAMRAVEREVPGTPLTQSDRLTIQKRLASVFPPFAAAALGLDGEAIQLISQGFLPVGIEFARAARRFDSRLDMAPIIQACRNAWTVCGLQPLLGETLRLTPSIVGYSLLYPYTDNYLDRNDVSAASKRAFCCLFRERLRGSQLAAKNAHEISVWTLVEMIECQYPRALYPQVYDSLLAIHRAQEESIAQLGPARAFSEADILHISCAKGGSSVLADACLVRGWLNTGESELAFDWGALLQFGDDLQDVHEDLRRGSATLFTRAIAESKSLDALAAQLLNFSARVGSAINRFPAGSASLKDLLRISWCSIIVAAIGCAPEFFSPAFLAAIERTSPFSFAFLRERRARLAGHQGLYANVFNVFLDEPVQIAPRILPQIVERSAGEGILASAP